MTLAGALLLLPLSLQPQDDLYYTPPELTELAAQGMRDVVSRYNTDLRTLRRWWDVSVSPQRRLREREFLDAWDAGLDGLEFESFGIDDRIDWLLLKNRISYERRRVSSSQSKWEETRELLPFADQIVEMQEARRLLAPIDGARVAEQLDSMRKSIEDLLERVTAEAEEADAEEGRIEVPRLVANRAASQVRSLRDTLGRWYRYYSGYDPMFSWWCERPYERANRALESYTTFLRETIAGVDEDDRDTILGDPIGADALNSELELELIPYTAKELVAIAEKELVRAIVFPLSWVKLAQGPGDLVKVQENTSTIKQITRNYENKYGNP